MMEENSETSSSSKDEEKELEDEHFETSSSSKDEEKELEDEHFETSSSDEEENFFRNASHTEIADRCYPDYDLYIETELKTIIDEFVKINDQWTSRVNCHRDLGMTISPNAFIQGKEMVIFRVSPEFSGRSMLWPIHEIRMAVKTYGGRPENYANWITFSQQSGDVYINMVITVLDYSSSLTLSEKREIINHTFYFADHSKLIYTGQQIESNDRTEPYYDLGPHSCYEWLTRQRLIHEIQAIVPHLI